MQAQSLSQIEMILNVSKRKNVNYIIYDFNIIFSQNGFDDNVKNVEIWECVCIYINIFFIFQKLIDVEYYFNTT